MEYRVGDIVSLTSNATYYDGKEVPEWVKGEQWIIKSINGDRIVIDESVNGNKRICSPVSIQYLRKVENKSQLIENPVKSENHIKTEMRISIRGLELIEKCEGCKLKAYRCPAGVWTIGYGHTKGVKQGDTLQSMDEAKVLLKSDIEKYENYVNASVKNKEIIFSLNQNQFDALVSFAYNCGRGSLKKLVSGRSAEVIADKILLYNKGGGKVLPGLVKRREEERTLFLM